MSSNGVGRIVDEDNGPAIAPPSADAATLFESNSRLSIPTPTRLLLGSLSSGIVGCTLGALQGGQTAQLRFRAEHAHKMPDSTAGWYLYHKSKNYHVMQGGIREGLLMGARTGFWTLMALGLESAVDGQRQRSDALSTVIATLSIAGAFSLWHRFTLPAAARAAKFGLLFGIAYGGLQDFVRFARERQVGQLRDSQLQEQSSAPSSDTGSL